MIDGQRLVSQKHLRVRESERIVNWREKGKEKRERERAKKILVSETGLFAMNIG